MGASAAGFEQACQFLGERGGQPPEDLQTVRGTMIRRAPGLVGALARGAEQQACAHGVRSAIPHGRGAALDGLADAVPAEQHDIIVQASVQASVQAISQAVAQGIAQSDANALPKHPANGGRLRRSGAGVENGEDFTHGFAEGVFLVPAREGFGRAVHQRDLAALLRNDNGFIDAAHGSGQALSAIDQLALAPVVVEGDLDGRAQGAVVKRFQDIAGGRGAFGALQDSGIGVRRKVHHRDLELIIQGARHVDTIQGAFQFDIHQD